MRAAIVAVCLIGSAALWIWAWAPWGSDTGEAVPAEFCGEFDLYRFVPAPGSDVTDPTRAGQRTRFHFRADGSFLYRALTAEDLELVRNEGSLAMNADGRLVLHQMSENRTPSEVPAQVYRPLWIDDKEAGRVLSLTAIPEGYQLLLKPVE